MTRALCLAAAPLALALLLGPASAQDAPGSTPEPQQEPALLPPWAGTYADEHIVIELQPTSGGDAFGGTIQVEGARYPVRGTTKLQGSSYTLEGAFSASGKEVPVSIRVNEGEDVALLETSGITYHLVRQPDEQIGTGRPHAPAPTAPPQEEPQSSPAPAGRGRGGDL
jgi:hypothetical protein